MTDLPQQPLQSQPTLNINPEQQPKLIPNNEDCFWKRVVGVSSDEFEGNCKEFDEATLNAMKNENNNFFKKCWSKCKDQSQIWFKNEIVKLMLIFFVGSFVFVFVMLLAFNPPLVQINKKLNKNRSFLKIMGFSLLFSIIFALLIPCFMKLWKLYTNRKSHSSILSNQQMTPALELVSL